MRSRTGILLAFPVIAALSGAIARAQEAGPPLPGTEPLTMTGDIASDAGRRGGPVPARADRRIDGEAGRALEARLRLGRGLRRLGRAEPQAAGAHPGRARPAGAVRRAAARGHDRPARPAGLGRRSTTSSRSAGRPSATCTARGCCWCPATTSGSPTSSSIPDADQTPEQLVGLVAGVPAESQLRPAAGRERLPGDRADADRPHRRAPQRPGQADQPRVPLSLGLRAGPAPDRLRGAEGAGRWSTGSSKEAGGREGRRSASSATAKGACSPSTPRRSTRGSTRPASAATSTTATTSGTQPIDRNVFGLLEQFGDAELASAGRAPGARSSRRRRAPSSSTRPGTGEAPGKIATPELDDGRGRGRPGPRARRRARRRPRRSSWSSAARRHRAVRHRARPWASCSPRCAPAPSSRPPRPSSRCDASGVDLAGEPGRPPGPPAPRDRPPQPAAPDREPVRPRRSSWRSSTRSRSRPTRRPSSRTARSSPTRSSAGST